jgi:hypothetical protein
VTDSACAKRRALGKSTADGPCYCLIRLTDKPWVDPDDYMCSQDQKPIRRRPWWMFWRRG